MPAPKKKLDKALEEQNTPCNPEHNMWLACLIDGIYSALKRKDPKDKYWLVSEKTHVGSINWICDHCGIDKDSLLSHLTKKTLADKTNPSALIHNNWNYNQHLKAWDRTQKKPRIFNQKPRRRTQGNS